LFLGFREVSDQIPFGLEKEIVNSTEENGSDLNKCHGQGYGGTVNSGIYLAVQAKREKNAEYLHCSVHYVNVALSDRIENFCVNTDNFGIWH
jgi:hypothetical protein